MYDEASLRAPTIQPVLLWLEQALTLAHEVAHAWDRTARSRRERWYLDETARGEGYAEATARSWIARTAVEYFTNPANCDAFMVALRWPDGVDCPTCGRTDVTYLANQRRWKCKGKHPRPQFSAKVGTIFED